MIHVDMSKCTGCRRCETACAFFHTGRVSRNLSRIKVLHLYETGIDGPVVCVQCKERYCLCPVNALTVGSLGQIVCAPTVCTGCGICETQCPIGAIELCDGIVYVCDLCGGRPQCVEACTEGAITYQPDGEHPSLALEEQEMAKIKKMTPDQKRSSYVRSHVSQICKKWRRTHG